jgi:hypothetical protein
VRVSIGPTEGVSDDARLLDNAARITDGAGLARLRAFRQVAMEEAHYAGTGSFAGVVSRRSDAVER